MLQRLDHYDTLEEIGRGGFAVVYRAHDTRLNRPVAVKIIHGNHAQDEGFVTRFRQEAEIAANLHHPRLIPVYDYGDYEGQLYLVMRLVPGGTLRDYLKDHAPLPLAETIPLLQQIASVLDYLHGQKLIHRDVKPSNILLEPLPSGLTAILTDFGLVRSAEKSLTLTDQVLGTPTYMAPEQVNNKLGSPSPQTDIYALTVMAYEMLTGRTPFVDDLPVQLMMAHTSTPPPSPLQFRPELGTWVADVLLKGLAKQPAARYTSATAFVEALQEIQVRQTSQIQQQQTLADLLAQIEPAKQKRDWLQVQQLCVQVMTVDRTNPMVLTLLAESLAALQQEQAEEIARRRREEQYQQALQAIDAEQWNMAIDLLQQLLQDGGTDLEIQGPLRRAEQGKRWGLWYTLAVTQMKAEAWQSATRFWVQLLEEQPTYRDGQKQFLATVKAWLGQLDGPAKVLATESRLQPVPAEALTPVVTPKAGETQVWEKDGKVMVYVPAGEFLYGEKKEKIYLAGYWIDKTPVTNAEYKRFLDANPKHPVPFVNESWATPYNWDEKKRAYPAGKENHPVVLISWHDAKAYADWAGKELPTEQEWEKAARGTDGREYPWGSEWRGGYANTDEAGMGGTSPVGQFSPRGDSPYGCVDMAGNIWEWTDSPNRGGDDTRRVVRGGSWYLDRNFARAAYRNHTHLDSRSYDLGCRVVRRPPSQ